MQEHILLFQTILAYWHKGKVLALTARALKSSRSKFYIYKCNLPSVMLPVVTYMCVCVSVGLGSSLSKHDFDIQEMVAPVSKKDIVSLLLIVTVKFAAYFVLLNLTSKNCFLLIVILSPKRNQVCYLRCLSCDVLCYFQVLQVCFRCMC